VFCDFGFFRSREAHASTTPLSKRKKAQLADISWPLLDQRKHEKLPSLVPIEIGTKLWSP
jgi:hypothetical protein